ncbi:hypothetical protein E2C01_086831 [Portunus trituberculatus]|uniref:Uncharacterized protein n=1 Tax=Portunus trituberculatus TaxID=210409 RepID=A0A5B7JBL3_PORTR|nr:hypothetical protein [Portunus trituberculatus]
MKSQKHDVREAAGGRKMKGEERRGGGRRVQEPLLPCWGAKCQCDHFIPVCRGSTGGQRPFTTTNAAAARQMTHATPGIVTFHRLNHTRPSKLPAPALLTSRCLPAPRTKQAACIKKAPAPTQETCTHLNVRSPGAASI